MRRRTLGIHLSCPRSTTTLQLESLESRHLLTAAPLVITEFMAANDNALLDGDGNSSDWIEIYNPTADVVSLDRWSLSDDATILNKWSFPPSRSIAPNEYLVVFASGQSNDQYVDAASFLHTNFKLSKDGEYLALSYNDPQSELIVVSEYAPEYPPQFEDVSYGIGISVASEILVGSGNQARLLVPTNNAVDAVWTDVDFDDSTWQAGPTGIGYENSPADYADLIRTTVARDTDTAYIRMNFSVNDVDELNTLLLRVKYDDGFLAYLNGSSTPVAQRNAPNNPDYQSTATGNHPDEDAASFVEFDLTNQLGLLQDGNNVLAIHSLNQGSSSDMLLVPELRASRPSSGSNASIGFFADPTPGAANTTGVANPGPLIRDVTETPAAISNGDDLIVTARVTELASPITDVQLNYRVMYGAEIPLVMVDDGSGSDEVAEDGIYTALIPASASRPGEMLRWKVTATDDAGNNSQAPAFLDSAGNGQSPEYYGTIVAEPFTTSLPVFEWFTQSESASHSRSGTRASVFYAGRFYDNVFVRRRGGATNSSQSQKFDFNRDHGLFISEELGTVGEINMNGNGSDPSYLRQSMGFEAHTASGGSASASFLAAMRLNGSFDRVGVWVEQVDADFLERQSYDRDGDLYKLVQRSNLQPAVSDTTTGVEKKTGNEQDLTTFAALVAGVERQTETQRQTFIRDNLDVAQVINYMAVRSLQHQADDVRKNMYLYNGAEGDGLWRIYPWDLDWTFNIVGGHDNSDSQRTEHPFFGTQDRPTADGANQWNKLYEALFETIEIQEMYLRRLRTLMDQFYGGASGGTTWFADYVNTNFPDIDPHLSSSVTNGKNSLLSSIQNRRSELYRTYTNNISGYSVVIPDAQPSRPQIDFGSLDFNPASGDQDQEFIELINPNDFAVDISGWQLAGGISHTFQPGTVVAAGKSLYVSPSVAAFRSRTTGPGGGQRLFVQEWNSGHLSNFAEPVELRSEDGASVATLTYDSQPTPNQLGLRLSEIHYHPRNAQPGELDVNDQRFEFVELINASSETLDLAGIYFSDGIEFQFPDEAPILLQPFEQVLIVADQAAFESRFGDGMDIGGYRIVGEFENGSALANGGEKVKLEDADGNTILEIKYDDEEPWDTSADGDGASLSVDRLLANEQAGDFFASADNWYASDPTPGQYVFVDNFNKVGDANRDGIVSFADFLILSANFGNTNATFEQGDFDGTNSVDFADFLLLSANFGKRV